MSKKPGVLRWIAVVAIVTGCGQNVSNGSGGGGARDCTLIGCVNGVTVTVDQAGERPLEVCVGPTCSEPAGSGGTAMPGQEMLRLEVPVEDGVEIVVRVAGGGDVVARTTATPIRSRPNGPTCDPECKTVRLRLTVDDQLVPD